MISHIASSNADAIKKSDDNDGLSGGVLAGIVIGVIVGLFVVVLLTIGIMYFISSRRNIVTKHILTR